jgi:hypothetical protein
MATRYAGFEEFFDANYASVVRRHASAWAREEDSAHEATVEPDATGVVATRVCRVPAEVP